MREGKYAEACEQLEQSQAIEVGLGTMLYLADCYERIGRTASAWALFREASSAARAEGQVERAQQGLTRASLLEPKLSKLSISVAAEHKLPGLVVVVNGVNLAPGVWGVPVPVDPGESRIEARAPGYIEWTTVQNLPPSGSVNVVVPQLVRDLSTQEVAAAAISQPPQAGSQPPAAAPAQTDRDGGGWAAQRTFGIVVGATGLVAMGVGTYFGVSALSKDSDADELCGATTCSTVEGAELAADANTAATLSNVFVFGGAALLVTGVVLYLTGPSPEEAPAIALGGDASGAHVTLRGVF